MGLNTKVNEAAVNTRTEKSARRFSASSCEAARPAIPRICSRYRPLVLFLPPKRTIVGSHARRDNCFYGPVLSPFGTSDRCDLPCRRYSLARDGQPGG